MGLLIMRLVAGGSLIAYGLMTLLNGPPAHLFIPQALGIVAGLLLIAGLWTPIAGASAAMVGIWNGVTDPANLWANIFLVTIAIALALLGPGAWSVDARLYGWKRIDIGGTKDPTGNRRE